MKLKLGIYMLINVISLYIDCVLYCQCSTAFVDMATESSRISIMEKVKLGQLSCLIGGRGMDFVFIESPLCLI